MDDIIKSGNDQPTPHLEPMSEQPNSSNIGEGKALAIPSDYSSYSKYAKRAIKNSLLLMEGAYGGGFYIKFLHDEGTCYGWLNLTIVYPDGSFKNILSYKNFLKEADTENGNGVFVSKEVSKSKGYQEIDWDGKGMLNNFSSLEPYATPQMPIPEKALWSKILENYREIPISRISQTASLEQLVAQIHEWAEVHSNEPGQGFLCDKDHSYITKEAFDNLVESNGWYVSKARVELDALGLFEKDPSSKGYQKSKRIGSEVKRFYLLKKNPSDEPTPPTVAGDVQFNPGFLSKWDKEEKEVQQLKRDYQSLLQKYNSLAAKTQDVDLEL